MVVVMVLDLLDDEGLAGTEPKETVGVGELYLTPHCHHQNDCASTVVRAIFHYEGQSHKATFY